MRRAKGMLGVRKAESMQYPRKQCRVMAEKEPETWIQITTPNSLWTGNPGQKSSAF